MLRSDTPSTTQAHRGSLRPSRVGTAHWLLRLIVTGSGFAGLGYEIVWTRMLSLALGTEMMAVLGVVAGFFGGMALGAFILDAPIRRARSPHAAYAALESIIGVWGIVSIFLLPEAGCILQPLLGIEPSPVLLWATGFALPALALLPATVAMGGTLTALDCMAVSASGDSRVAAGIYGGNTAGAVAGTLAAAFVLLPALGLSGTLGVLSVVNAACAAAALAIGRGAPAKPETIEIRPSPGRASAGWGRLTATLLATGFLGVAFEVIVVRLAAQVLQDTIYTFAGLLACYLLGTACGGLAWQFAIRRRHLPYALGGLLAVTSLVCLGTALLTPAVGRLAQTPAMSGVAGELVVALALFLLPSAAMGALFSELAQAVRDARGSLGWAVGVNSLGAAAAPLVSAQLLIPAFGTWAALLPVSLLYLPLLPIRRTSLAWCAAPVALGAVLWLRPAPSLIRVPLGGTLIAEREGPMTTASVVEDASGARYLDINGHFRMGGTNSVRSDYRQAMVPLLIHPSPRTALFLGLGTGATLVGGSLMPHVAVRGVELSPEVAALLPLFKVTSAAAPALPPPPPITIADARRYVLADHAHYDVIVADLYHPALDGSGNLYTTDHFAAVRKRLAPGGLFCQWLPLYQLDLASLRTIIRGFLDVYPDGAAWLNHYSVGTPMLALVGGRGPIRIDPVALATRLTDPETAQVLGPLGLMRPIDLLGQYVGGPHALATFAGKGVRNTDDFPAVALDAQRNVRALSAPRAALLLTLIGSVHPDSSELLAQGSDASWRARLTAYWQARDRFLQAGAALHGSPSGLALVEAAAPGLLDTIRLSPEFDPAYQPLLGMARMLAESDREGAVRLLREVNAAAPFRSEAREMMSRMH